MNKRLNKNFFHKKSTIELAKALLGKVFVRKINHHILAGTITETEAYTQEDEACHAFNGKKTKRTSVMFLHPGHLYVYFTYGIHYCANITAEEEGRGCAVLIRSVLPVQGIETIRKNRIKYKEKEAKKLTNGPAKFTQAFQLTLKENGLDLCRARSDIYIADSHIKPKKIYSTPRIGISKAKELLWRFSTDSID